MCGSYLSYGHEEEEGKFTIHCPQLHARGALKANVRGSTVNSIALTMDTRNWEYTTCTSFLLPGITVKFYIALDDGY